MRERSWEFFILSKYFMQPLSVFLNCIAIALKYSHKTKLSIVRKIFIGRKEGKACRNLVVFIFFDMFTIGMCFFLSAS